MSTADLRAHVARLEDEVAQIKQKPDDVTDAPWWKKVVGVFADDPTFEEAMGLGREYREAQRLPEDAQF